MKHLLTSLLLVASTTRASLVEYPCDNHGIGHLTPFFKGVTYEERYRKLLESRLGLTPFDCGREIVWPDLGPEICVAIFSRIQNRRRIHWVTLTVPGKSSFWQVTDGMNRKLLNEASKIPVLRSDAEISEIRANLIREAWSVMIRNAHPENYNRPSPDGMRVIMGGNTDFYLQTPHGVQRASFPALPECNSAAHVLLNLCNTLIAYCEAKPSERERLGKRAEAQAKLVVRKLSSKHAK